MGSLITTNRNNPVVGADLDPTIFTRSSGNQISLVSTYSKTERSLIPAKGSAPDHYILSANGTWVPPSSAPISTLVQKGLAIKPRIYNIPATGVGDNPIIVNDPGVVYPNSAVLYYHAIALVLVGKMNSIIKLPNAPDYDWNKVMQGRIIAIKAIGNWAGNLTVRSQFPNGIDGKTDSETVGYTKVRLSSTDRCCLIFRWSGSFWARLSD